MTKPFRSALAGCGVLAMCLAFATTGCEEPEATAQQPAGSQASRPHGGESSLMAAEVDMPKAGVAVLHSKAKDGVDGTIHFEQTDQGLRITGKVKGLEPGKHGFHIHEYGDLSDPEAKSAGGHYNPDDSQHGGPDMADHHAGDLGNIEAGQDGVANVDMTAPWLKLHFVVGRAMVVHGGEDDLQSQPSGDAGPRVAAGVIGVAKGK
ncbi:superoxide dismutase family protein [Botrimarina sp.]|uniref:superoxide dismutase family protein n=1 Tax=Botrimarina sp. TaxID=2795802 RepID=UPI0032ECC962